VADRFVGSWLAGKGGCINGSALKMNVIKVSDNSVRFASETVRYENESNCTGNIVASYRQAEDFSLVSNIGAPQTVQTSSYNKVDWQLVVAGKLTQKQPAILGFKNANQFCLVPTDEPNAIHNYLQQANFDLTNTCFTKTTPPASMQKPTQVLATASFRLGDNKESWADVLSQLNDQGRQGYALLTPSVRLDNPDGSFALYKNLYVKNNKSTDTYTYKTVDVKTNSVANRYLLWVNELNKQGSLGYIYKLSFGEVTSDTDKYLFVKNDKKPATYSYSNRFLTNTSRTSILNAFNELGAQGCKLIYANSEFTNNGTTNGTFYVPTCVNSSTHNGTYAYRYFEVPQHIPFNKDDAIKLEKLLKEQAAEGYRLVDANNNLGFFNIDGYLFERDSENTGPIEYKVFIEDAASETDEPYIFENRIQDQGTLGWFFAVRLGSVYTNSPTNYDLASGVVFPK
ncbi:PT dipeptide repeat lipoprotein, partial [Acinetobacter pittii]